MKYFKAISLTINLAITRFGWKFKNGKSEMYGFIGFATAWKVASIIYLGK